MIDVVIVGSLNLDLVARCARHPEPGETLLGTTYEEFPGGKGLNQAVAAARAGAAVGLIGSVGDDDAGRRLTGVARDAGIDVAGLTIESGPTGRAMIVVDDAGENTIVVVPGANATARTPPIPRARVVLAQLEIPIETVEHAFVAARSSGATTVLNPAPAGRLSPALLATCDIAIPNEHEVTSIGGVDGLHAAGVEVVIVTRGEAGVVVSHRGGTRNEHPAMPAEVVDTTGAGDAFCGNFAARLALGDDVDDAVRWAQAAGALTVGARGAVPSLPHASATEAMLRSSRPR